MAKKKDLLVDCFTKKVKVIEQDLRDEYSVDVVAASVMECLQSKVGPALFDLLNSVLLDSVTICNWKWLTICWTLLTTISCTEQDAILLT